MNVVIGIAGTFALAWFIFGLPTLLAHDKSGKKKALGCR